MSADLDQEIVNPPCEICDGWVWHVPYMHLLIEQLRDRHNTLGQERYHIEQIEALIKGRPIPTWKELGVKP